MKELRRHRRVSYLGPVQIAWQDRGETRYVRGRCLDASDSGLRVELPVSIPVTTEIQLNSERIRISGSARVRHIARHGAKYILGIELAQNVRREPSLA